MLVYTASAQSRLVKSSRGRGCWSTRDRTRFTLGAPPGTVPILVRITDPAVLASLTVGNCVDIYVGEPAAPLSRVLSGGSVIALAQPEISEAALKPNSSLSMGYMVIAVIMSSAEKVAGSTSSSIIFATVCGG